MRMRFSVSKVFLFFIFQWIRFFKVVLIGFKGSLIAWVTNVLYITFHKKWSFRLSVSSFSVQWYLPKIIEHAVLKVAGVINTNLVFTDCFFYNLVVLFWDTRTFHLGLKTKSFHPAVKWMFWPFCMIFEMFSFYKNTDILLNYN